MWEDEKLRTRMSEKRTTPIKGAHLEKFCQKIHIVSMITQPPAQEDKNA